MKELLQDLHTYLSSTKDLYPVGIPQREVSLPEADVAESVKPRDVGASSVRKGVGPQKVHIVTGADLPADLQSFLQTIITAGMKLSLDDCTICSDDIDFTDMIHEKNPRAVLVFGGLMDIPDSIEPGIVATHEDVPVLVARALGEIKVNPKSKKEFWDQLQVLLKSLEAH